VPGQDGRAGGVSTGRRLWAQRPDPGLASGLRPLVGADGGDTLGPAR